MEIFVRRNDSLWYYSELFNIPLILVENSNLQIDPTNLSIGQRVLIPGYTLTNYEIKENDTFWLIANRFNIPLDALSLVNQTINPNNLTVGQTINIPHRVTNLVVDDI